MKILVTGAKGFVGKNLCTALKNLKDGKDKTRPALSIEEIFEYDIDSNPADLEAYCKQADFVFNLAGVNRPQIQEEFMQGNFGFASTMLDTLKKYGNMYTTSFNKKRVLALNRTRTLVMPPKNSYSCTIIHVPLITGGKSCIPLLLFRRISHWSIQ